jgi:hypothetical protein
VIDRKTRRSEPNKFTAGLEILSNHHITDLAPARIPVPSSTNRGVIDRKREMTALSNLTTRILRL